MALIALRTWQQFLEGSSDLSLWMNQGGGIENTPRNLFPDPFGLNIAQDGEPEGWDLSGMPSPPVGKHVNLSRPGAPNRRSLTRQNTTLIPTREGSYVFQEPWVPGIQGDPTDDRKPQSPDLETVPNGSKGYEAGRYGEAFGYTGPYGSTTPSGVRYFDLLAGEFPRVPAQPRVSGATHLDIYITRKGGGADTLSLQRRVPFDRITDDYIDVPGPWRNRGRPPSVNQSGVGRGPKPIKGRDYGTMNSDYDTLAGLWEPMVQIRTRAGGLSLLGPAGEPVRVKASTYRVRVPGPAPANVQPSEASANAAYSGGGGSSGGDNGGDGPSGRPDPREIRPSGKRSGREYLGQEIDFRESGLVAEINARRAEGSLPPLVLNAKLNRAAYNAALEDDPEQVSDGERVRREGYEGYAEGHYSDPVVLLESGRAMGVLDLSDPRWDAIGVACEGGSWVVFFGDDPELPDATEMYCEKIRVEHVDEDGTLYSSEVEYADVRLAWDLVVNGNMRYSYNGSFGEAVEAAAKRTHALGVVNVTRASGVPEVAITDGALGGAMARTSSDGRIVLDAAVYRRGTRNAKYAATIHEFFHALGFDHVSVASVLNTPVYLNGSNNHEYPTSYDRSEYRSVYGTGGGSSAGGGGGEWGSPDDNEIRSPRTGSPDGPAQEEPPPEPEFHWEKRTSSVKEKTALFFRPPKVVRRKDTDLRYTYWWLHTSPAGVQTLYRAAAPGVGAGAYFGDSGRIECPGLSPEAPAKNERGRAPRVKLVQETEKPAEDTTVIEPPDPSGVPDEPLKGGQEVLPAGRYLVTVNDEYEDGSLSQQSEPGTNSLGNPYIDITSAQMPKVVFDQSLNLVKNAEGAQLNGQGLPEDVILENAGVTQPGYVTPRGGRWEIGVTSSTNLVPRALFRAFPVDADTVLTVAGTVAVVRGGTGSLRVSLRQLDDSRQALRDAQNALVPGLAAFDLAATGETTFVSHYGTKGTALDPRTAYLQPIFGLFGSTVNLDGFVEDFRIYPLPVDVGKVDGEAGSFDPSPDTPAPAGSFALVGVPPEPAPGAAGTSLTDPAIAVEGFASGAVGARWSDFGNAPGRGIQTGAALFSTHGYGVADATRSVSQMGGIQALFPELGTGPGAFRALYRFDQLPTTGGVRFHQLARTGNINVAHLYVDSLGNLGVIVVQRGKAEQLFWLGLRITAGQIVDAEIVFEPGVSGRITVLVGVNRQRSVVFSRNFDLFGFDARALSAGVVAFGDPRTAYSVAFDQLVVTPNGDSLNREAPQTPVGIVVPPEDRPTKSGAPRRLAPGGVIRQLRILLEPGSAPADSPALIPLLERPLNVRPGVQYGFGVFARWSAFTENPGLIRVWLESEDALLEPVIAATLTFSGERGWQTTDDFVYFTVPDGYTTARLEFVGHDGFFVFQEFHFPQNPPLDFAGRDAMRDGGRALTGTGEWILDTHPEAYELGLQPGLWLSEVGAKHLPGGNETEVGTFSATFATSSDRLTWAPFTAPGQPAMRLIRFSLSLTSDGVSGPIIPAAGVYVRTWQSIGILTREDGSPFPGGAWVGNLLSRSAYPDTETRRIGGHLSPVRTSEEIERLQEGFAVVATTEDAKREIEHLSRTGLLRIELPTAGGTVAGESWLLRTEGGITLTPQQVPPRIVEEFGISHRAFFAAGEVGYAEILQAGPQQPPMGPPVSTRQLELAAAVVPS